VPTPERIDNFIAALTADRRAPYLFHTKTAADAVGCHPNKFSDWYQRNRAKLIELYIAQPGETAAEMAALIAVAEAERQRRAQQAEANRPPLRIANH